MKWLLPISFLTISPCVAQVGIDVPLQFTGPTGQRGIDGIASPTSADQLITVGHAVSGMAHWCIAVLNADTFELSMDPTSGPLASGTMLRFIATQEISGPVFVRINELNPYPLLRGDGIDPVAGQIEAGAICELVLSDGVFTLTAPSRRGCPATGRWYFMHGPALGAYVGYCSGSNTLLLSYPPVSNATHPHLHSINRIDRILGYERSGQSRCGDHITRYWHCR